MRRSAVLLVALTVIMLLGNPAGAWSHHPKGRHTTASYYEGSVGTFGPLVGNYAASKWWKGGSHVKVCTHRNGHNCVRVTILDRCQCGLDLRKSVFIDLFGSTSQGTGRVWMEKA